LIGAFLVFTNISLKGDIIMSFERVSAYFETQNLKERVVFHETPSDTVAHAAQACQCQEAQIAKTMAFLLKDGQAILIVAAGDAKINSAKFKKIFAQKAIFLPFEQVQNYTGCVPGGVCPFALEKEIAVYLDVSMKRFPDVYVAAGHPQATVHLTTEELEQHSKAKEWIDVCKDWSDCEE